MEPEMEDKTVELMVSLVSVTYGASDGTAVNLFGGKSARLDLTIGTSRSGLCRKRWRRKEGDQKSRGRA